MKHIYSYIIFFCFATNILNAQQVEYDKLGRLVKYTDLKDNTYTYQFDKLGNRILYQIQTGTVPNAELTFTSPNLQKTEFTQGEQLQILLNLQNTKAVNASGFYITTVLENGSESYEISREFVTGLNANSSVEKSFWAQIPAEATLGAYQLDFFIDATEIIDEDDETNNEASIAISVIEASGEMPVPAFISSVSEVLESGIIQFTDQSINQPIAWEWNFSGGSPLNSTVQNPTVTYNLPGIYPVTLTVSNANGTQTQVFQDYIMVTSVLSNSQTQTINLRKGLNYISIAVDPINPSVDNIFGNIAPSINRVQQIERIYNPSLPVYLNTLNELIPGFGYKVWANRTVTLTVIGQQANMQRRIPLNRGYNMLGYLLPVEIPASEALADIWDKILELQDENGLNIKENPETVLKQGKAYLVKVSEDLIFIYNTDGL